MLFRMGDWLSVLISSGATVSQSVNLSDEFLYMQVEVPTIDSANISFQVARTQDGDYRALGSGSKLIPGSTGNFITWVWLGGFQFVKVVSSASQTADRTFYVRGLNRIL